MENRHLKIWRPINCRMKNETTHSPFFIQKIWGNLFDAVIWVDFVLKLLTEEFDHLPADMNRAPAATCFQFSNSNFCKASHMINLTLSVTHNTIHLDDLFSGDVAKLVADHENVVQTCIGWSSCHFLWWLCWHPPAENLDCSKFLSKLNLQTLGRARALFCQIAK